MATDFEKHTNDIYAAFNAHDLKKFGSLHTDDVIVENVATGVVSRARQEGLANIKLMIDAIPDLKLELTSSFTSGNRQCEEYLMRGTHKGDLQGIPATGKSLSVRGVLVRELREGKTCRVTQYTDYATIMRQLGVLPSPPQK